MKLTPYVKAIVQTDEDKQKALAPAHAEQTKAALGLKIAELGIEVGELELQVKKAGAAYPLDADALSEALDQHALATRRLDQLTDIKGQLFPAE